jgi:hypothetical protein
VKSDANVDVMGMWYGPRVELRVTRVGRVSTLVADNERRLRGDRNTTTRIQSVRKYLLMEG